MSTTLQLKLTPGPQAASAARIALHDLEQEVSAEVLREVRLMVSELVTNAIRHAGEEPDTIELRARVDSERLCIEVWDDGPGFDPSAPADRGDQPGGWGLYIVDTLSDRWGVGREGSMANVWFEIFLDERRSATFEEEIHRFDAPEDGRRPPERRSPLEGRPRFGGAGYGAQGDERLASAAV